MKRQNPSLRFQLREGFVELLFFFVTSCFGFHKNILAANR